MKKFENGGEGGIRTLDRELAYTRVPVVRLQPLSHLSTAPKREAILSKAPHLSKLFCQYAELTA